MAEPVVELQRQVFTDLDDLCSSLNPEQWDLATDCPGWTVKDNLSHIVGTESMLLGREAPEHQVDEKPWVRNPIGASNEIQVDYRRARTGAEVLEEFRDVYGERVKALENLSADELGAESWTPIGPGTVRDLLAVRVMDCWVHEQDIRRAVGKPGGLEGPVAAHAFARHSGAIPFVVGKKAAAPDGTTVVVEVAGYQPFAIGVEGKRANRLDSLPDSPTVRLRTDLDTFNRLCTGRGDPEPLKRNVEVDGDSELGARILDQINFMV
jgi:uncharacterized protein (TIGR03083 family)